MVDKMLMTKAIVVIVAMTGGTMTAMRKTVKTTTTITLHITKDEHINRNSIKPPHFMMILKPNISRKPETPNR